MAVLLSPLFNPDAASVDSNGDPRSGGHLHIYLAGTSTPATAYQDSAGSVAHTNPIILNANGLAPAPIWLTTGSSYKMVLAPAGDTTPPASPITTIDNISAVNDTAVAATSTEWTASGMTPTYISATSFSVAGDQTTVLHVGRRLKITVTAGTVYATIIKSAYTSLTTLTVLTDSGSVDSGISAFSYGIASANNTSLPFISRDQQCGRLVYVSATSIRLDPQDGNTIWVYSGSNWRRRIIPSAGISMANTGLAANTGYYVYLYDNAGVLTMEASTTAPAVDATSGLMIKTGDATRLLVGMVRTQGSTPGQFQTPALVLSWYKRRGITASASFTTPRTTTSTSYVEINAEIQTKFLAWAEEPIVAQFTGYASNSTVAQVHATFIGLDAGLTEISGVTAVNTATANYGDNISIGAQAAVAEGYHYATIVGSVSANTGTWSAGKLMVLTQG